MRLTTQEKNTLIICLIILTVLFLAKWLIDHRYIPQPVPKNPVWVNSAPDPTTLAWMEELARNEKCSPEGTWDTGSYSYGKYCYKILSWREDASSTRFYENAEMIELDNFRGDPYEQDRVLAWVVENRSSSHLVMRWKTSIIRKGVGLPKVARY